MSQSLTQLLAVYHSLPLSSQRAVAAVVGASVGDAASRPFHWLYDQPKLQEIVGASDPAFWPESQSPFYTLPTGRRSCYNDQCYCMLKSLPTSNQPFIKGDFFNTMKAHFAEDGEYGIALQRRKEAYHPARRLDKRDPIEGPWQQQAVTYFLNAVESDPANVKGDGSINESDGLCCSIPFVARLCVQERGINDDHGSGTFDGLFGSLFAVQVGEVIELLSSSEMSMQYSTLAARILRRTILHPSASDTLSVPEMRSIVDEEVAQMGDAAISQEYERLVGLLPAEGWGSAADSWIDEGYIASEHSFGRACAFPGAFFGSMLAVLSCHSFGEAVRRNIVTGGCNCSRANIIGALMGAAYGIGHAAGIDAEWIARTDKGTEIFAMAIERCAGHAIARDGLSAEDAVGATAATDLDRST